MVFYGFFYGSIINNFYGSIISRLFYCFLFFFYGSIKFNQVEFPSFFQRPHGFSCWIFPGNAIRTSTGSGSQKISWSSCAANSVQKKPPCWATTKKNWQSLPSLTKGDFKFNIFFNIQFFVDLNVMSMISYQYSIHGDFLKTRNEPRLCVSLFTTVYWILVATTPFYLQVRGFQSNIDRGEPSL